jgi:predicted ester cyclase
MIVEGNHACAYYRMAGTHTGTFMGIPATGTSVDVPGIGIYKVSEGKIQESWVVRDTLVLLRQLGVDLALPHNS